MGKIFEKTTTISLRKNIFILIINQVNSLGFRKGHHPQTML